MCDTSYYGRALLSAMVLIAFAHTSCSSAGKGEKIPLDSIYATSDQKGLKEVSLGEDEPHHKEMEALRRNRKLTTNVFLVRGKDISGAIKATHEVFFLQRSGDLVRVPKKDEGGQVWLAVFFGVSGSVPPTWAVESVERSEGKSG